MTLKIVPSEEWHCEDLAPRVREADHEEVMASCGLDMLEVLKQSMAHSQEIGESWTAMVDDRPFAMFGLVHATADFAAPWLLASEELLVHRRFVWQWSREFVAAWQEDYPVLGNFVARANSISHRWLRRLGFRPDGEKEMGGLLFDLMVKEAADV
ncbi:MAG: hypothetical protein ACXIUZ_02010 [Lysobacteraceae bacterium]